MAMRVGPFSNQRIIDYINRFYVPVFVSNEDYATGKFGDVERQRLHAIRVEAEGKGLSAGSVQVFLLSSQGEVLDSEQVVKTIDGRRLLAMLRATSEDLGTRPGETLIAPKPTSQPPQANADALVLQSKARFHDRLMSYVDDWIVLSESEWRQFLRSPASAADSQWDITPEVARKILVPLYPYSADWDINTQQIQEVSLTLRKLPAEGRQRMLAISGTVSRIQNLQPNAVPRRVHAEVVGLVRVGNHGRPEISILTYNARYGSRTFDGLITSIAPLDPDSVQVTDVH